MSNDGLAKENNIDWSLDNRHMWENTYGKSPNEKVYNYSALEAQREIAEQLKRIADNLYELNQPTIITKEAVDSDKTINLADDANMAVAAEMLWVCLANVSGGDWTKQSKEWQEAAAKWRDYYGSVKVPLNQDTVDVDKLLEV